MITVLDEKTVAVTPGEVTAEEILEYAKLLIETEGWQNWSQSGGKESSPDDGWTLHDAIGEANRRLFHPETRQGDSHGKEGTHVASAGATTRNLATRKLQSVLPNGMDDKTWDNAQTSVNAVLAKLEEAIKA